MRWAYCVADVGETINTYKILRRKPDGNRSLGIPRRKSEDKEPALKGLMDRRGLVPSGSGF
jgi:hypothetical protein